MKDNQITGKHIWRNFYEEYGLWVGPPTNNRKHIPIEYKEIAYKVPVKRRLPDIVRAELIDILKTCTDNWLDKIDSKMVVDEIYKRLGG